MRHSPHHHLLDDTLHPDALVESLAATRRAARGRRLTRRATRVGAAGVLLLAVVLVLIRPPWSPATLAPLPPPHLPALAALPPSPKSHLVVGTRPGSAAVVVRTTNNAGDPAQEKRSVEIVSTRTASRPLLRVSEDDLFAAAGPRPAAMHHLPDGSARWIWLDSATFAR